MKILRNILFGIVGLIVLVFIVSFFLKKEYSVTREVVINKPKVEVFNYLKYLKNQENFSVWAKMDPDMKKEFKGTDGTVGFVSSWDSKKDYVGKGEQEIKAIVPGERIEYELRFIEPFKSTSPAYIETVALGDDKTKVIWGFKGYMGVPSNLMLLIMDFEKLLGNDLQNGLDNLKAELE